MELRFFQFAWHVFEWVTTSVWLHSYALVLAHGEQFRHFNFLTDAWTHTRIFAFSYFQQWHTTRQQGLPSKQKASSRTYKDGKMYAFIIYRGRKTNIWVTEKTKVSNVFKHVKRQKWTWAGNVSRILDNQWTSHITIWRPYEREIPRGKPDRWTRRLLVGCHLTEDIAISMQHMKNRPP